MLHSYLSNALQHSQCKQPVHPPLCSQRGEQGEDSRSQHAQTQEDLPSIVAGQVTPRDLSAQVAKEERTQQPALNLRVPKVLGDLEEVDGEREDLESQLFKGVEIPFKYLKSQFLLVDQVDFKDFLKPFFLNSV